MTQIRACEVCPTARMHAHTYLCACMLAFAHARGQVYLRLDSCISPCLAWHCHVLLCLAFSLLCLSVPFLASPCFALPSYVFPICFSPRLLVCVCVCSHPCVPLSLGSCMSASSRACLSLCLCACAFSMSVESVGRCGGLMAHLRPESNMHRRARAGVQEEHMRVRRQAGGCASAVCGGEHFCARSLSVGHASGYLPHAEEQPLQAHTEHVSSPRSGKPGATYSTACKSSAPSLSPATEAGGFSGTSTRQRVHISGTMARRDWRRRTGRGGERRPLCRVIGERAI